MFSISVVCFTNDSMYRLREFVDYYAQVLNITNFYIYYNGRVEDVKDLCSSSVLSIHLEMFQGEAQQFPAYQHFYNHFRGLQDYCLLLDTDEFLVLKVHSTIADFILENPPRSTLLLPRKEFGYVKGSTPETPVFQCTNVMDIDRVIFKSLIYCPEWQNGVPCLHNPTRNGYFQGQHFSSPFLAKTKDDDSYYDTIQLNHYYVRSKVEFEKKAQGKRADTGEPKLTIPRIVSTLESLRSEW